MRQVATAGKQHLALDVARCHAATDTGEREDVRRIEARLDRRADVAHDAGDPREHPVGGEPRPDGRDDVLLPPRAREVVAVMARAGVLERDLPGHELRPGLDVQPLDAEVRGRVGLVADRALHVDEHAADRIHDLRERFEVDEGVAVQLDPEEPLDRLLREVRAAERERGVHLLVAGARDRYEGVARHREHRRGAVHRIDRQHDDRVGIQRIAGHAP